MECHKCGWEESVRSGKFEGVPWEETPCAKCRMEDGPAEKRMVPYDDEKGSARPSEEIPAEGVEWMPVGVLADALRFLFALPRDALEVLRLRYGGMPYAEIAERLGASVKSVECRMARTLEAQPVLVELFPRKAKALARRRAKSKALRRSAGVR